MTCLVFAAFAGLWAGPDGPAHNPAVEFVYVPDVTRVVSFPRGKHLVVGRFDQHGDFHEETRVVMGGHIGGGLNTGERLNTAQMLDRPAFEYRSGALVPGVLASDGRFVPKVGGTVKAFADYRYTPNGPPIWNLPGYFKPVTTSGKTVNPKG